MISKISGKGWIQAKYFCFVKTYPNISTKYIEVTCTAGILELPEGRKLVRVYPVPYRLLDNEQKFPKFSWLDVTVKQDTRDGRPESYKLRDPHKLRILETLPVSKVSKHIKTENWKKRKSIIIDFVEPIGNIINNWKEKTLGIIKPKEVFDFYIKEEKVKLSKKQKAILKQKLLYTQSTPLEMPPVSFHYKFTDDAGNKHDYKLLDWEVYQAYRSWRKKYPDKNTLFAKLKERFLYWMIKNRDLYFVIGNHNRWRNSFFIVGLLYFPKS